MNFSEALEVLKLGSHMYREAWEKTEYGSPLSVYLDISGCYRSDKPRGEYFLKLDSDGSWRPWSVPHADLLADDWLQW